MRTFYRKVDGQMYFTDIDGELMAAPTHADGTIALDRAAYVDDFMVPPSAEERRFILQHLSD
ncbi:MAG: hypothetical protein K2Y37_20915 [Pirellulales bacterium]|nr:hypothetical protein [Pirellulales bacterium]